MQQRLKEFAKLYDVIKNERNKIVNLIQKSTQTSAEMKEKIKILANEMEILRTAVSQKERYDWLCVTVGVNVGLVADVIIIIVTLTIVGKDENGHGILCCWWSNQWVLTV